MAQDPPCLRSAGKHVWSPSQAQWVKDLVLTQLRLRWQIGLGSDPWPGNSICLGAAKKEKEKKKKSHVKYATYLKHLQSRKSPVGLLCNRITQSRSICLRSICVCWYGWKARADVISEKGKKKKKTCQIHLCKKRKDAYSILQDSKYCQLFTSESWGEGAGEWM